MLEEYSIMDWVTLGTIVANVGVVLGAIVQLYRDNKSLSNELKSLSKEHARIQDKIVSERKILSRDTQFIMEDTQYISDEMKIEKLARENLYKSSSRAKEILETMDMMREVVLQNAQLNVEISELKAQVTVQEAENKVLSQENVNATIKLSNSIDRRLADFESFRDTEEIQWMLRNIKTELSEYG